MTDRVAEGKPARRWWTLDEVLSEFGFTRAELEAEMGAKAVESDTSANARPDTPDNDTLWPEGADTS